MSPGLAAEGARLLSPADLPDNFTRSLYKIAPYRGCAHGCRYCDGRAERYYVEGDFEKDIVERLDLPGRLERDLERVREYGIVAFGSGTTDPYQPREADLRITERCARLLADYADHANNLDGGPGRGGAPRLPALVMTKSELALRDLALWKRVAAKSGFVLLVSIAGADEGVRREMEPGAASYARRFEMARLFKEAGCAVGVLAMPFLPGLTDSADSIRSVYAAAAAAGADFVMPGGLTLRPGRQKDFYIKALEAHNPSLVRPTLDIYRAERPSGAPTAQARRELDSRIAPIRKEMGMPWLLPHRAFAAMLPTHDSFRLLLRDMIELYGERGVDTGALVRSADRYDAWLLGSRRYFRRRRNLEPAWLELRLGEALASGELAEVLDNERLCRFARRVIAEGALLDYTSLGLSNVKAPRVP
ncbi:MAG: radical SAM protein [Spirochaetaceae bacterium]|nr:radical SAM protein [Spirochaetaceae bacterium]